jgi:glycosyltransferase involved in cell wall biosynthesis
LSCELAADYVAFTDFNDSKFLGWLRYPFAVLQTTRILFTKKPELLFVQNPSILLAYTAALLRPFLGFRLVIDLHTLYIQPNGVKKIIAGALNNFALKHCDAVIVTNEAYKQQIAARTDRPVLVLADKIPEFERDFQPVSLKGSYNILYICTFASDEPWQEVIAAAALVTDDICIHISGRNRVKQADVPKNVILTGYLATDEYRSLLHSVDAVMVLTTANDCLVCGGYEAVAAGKPLILSDTVALRGFFSKGTVFTANRRNAIAAAIGSVRNDTLSLTTNIKTLKAEMAAAWEQQWRSLLAELESLRVRP